ncbi:hypothetical protein BU25DRAFT_458103 [Macroventuria anomochaeta]|uniref:Uncharacterized protein n=1 Tax=Macroventuria anomochaeta TaxID=301207 RepID=A0ACB6S2R9_9PLEO|nr:uncharacterized protein BU25DRAFT_458103 [Macroventuria anomochaeta]KAF2628262.1 hypothetical protein BU25DRAFT_458103 [Macroventuria anomochaeta]
MGTQNLDRIYVETHDVDTSDKAVFKVAHALLRPRMKISRKASSIQKKSAHSLSGNELNYFTTFCNIGYMIMLYPSCIIVFHFGPSKWLPTCELICGILTWCLSTVTNYKQQGKKTIEDEKFEVVHAELSLNRVRVRGDKKEIGEEEEILECLNEELEVNSQESQTT